jgi:hypothetical protein
VDHQKAPAILLSHFFHLEIPKFTWAAPFCQLVTPEVCAERRLLRLSSAHAFISSQLHTTRHPSFITPTATRRKSIAEARRTNTTFLSQSYQASRHTIT